jgi:imidazole glycerol-phosphate synthase subunit HisH
VREGRAAGEDAAEHQGFVVIALIDYKAGNLTSVRKALSFIGADFVVPESTAACADARGLIVPGVGHFSATLALDASWRRTILDAVTAGTPLLGICVGMQWLFEGSDEAPDVSGLGLMRGRIARLEGDAGSPARRRLGEGGRLKVPHVGWNALEMRKPGRLLAGLAPGAQVYFTHSYAAPVTDTCAAETTHANLFSSAVERDNVFGVQFHPEKSGDAGLQILRNFLAVVEQS